jgi:hypothetical protein
VTQLTTSGTGGDEGSLHPKFNDDGTRLMWNRPKANPLTWTGLARLCTADFVVTGVTPSLANIVEHTVPGMRNNLFEPGSWLNESEVVVANLGKFGIYRTSQNIMKYNLDTQEVTWYTDWLTQWSEFPELSPDGQRLAFTTTVNQDNLPFNEGFAVVRDADLWIMDVDGTSMRQVTFFDDPDHPTFMGNGYIGFGAADPTWISDTEIVLKVTGRTALNPDTTIGIVRVTL